MMTDEKDDRDGHDDDRDDGDDDRGDDRDDDETQRSSSTFCPLPDPGLPALSFLPSLSPQGPLFLLVLMLFIQVYAELSPYFLQVSVYTARFGKNFTEYLT